ncbi:polysaccharide deacetylase family protein [Pseudonocardia parietis]|uniref:Peptidoglycan/xylan/chitin deacetylase (PgdA/CDA1 family) n=1 Tax=Pseudonocardia parietis TaxID=570936 RepID=A0ABS4W5M2_9PSEU|nr:polysaccharide deacetylase family protein [Pseudonocardia parietis]MBP2371504.1 peptidoglycan/xylan/chitin deacetylase (PgdA/CDA1 family) [Pseudonocardia parietis]
MTNVVPILMYHSVKEDPPATTRNLSVRPEQLRSHLQFLRENGFTGLTFADLCNRARRDACDMPERPIVLTFDDGYADVHEEALPLLAEHGFPATVFVTTGWLRDSGMEAAGRPLDRMMAWTQVRELADAGLEVAAHSHSHPELDQLSDRALRAELIHGRSLLEDRLGIEVPSLAYPFGYSSRRVRDATAEAGYQQAAAVMNAVAERDADPFAVPRLTVRRSTSPALFRRIASCEELHRVFRIDRALTNGWTVVRRSRSLMRRVRRG